MAIYAAIINKTKMVINPSITLLFNISPSFPPKGALTNYNIKPAGCLGGKYLFFENSKNRDPIISVIIFNF